MSNPQSRNEAILQNILGEDNTLTPPQSRTEELLQAILTHGEYDKEPQSRNEALLAEMLEEVDTKLIPENIRKDVEIFGTVGTLEGGSSVDVEALSVDQNGTYTAPEGTAYSPVTVNVSGGGGQEVPEKDVNFIDYDGTVLYSYTAQEALALTALPANPSHEGLTAQGWNYTLAEVKTEVNAVGGATIGQMYVTDDGKTRLYCHFEEGRLTPYLGIGLNGTAEVDWGDGSAVETVTGSSFVSAVNLPHTYAAPGDYVISIDVKSGNIMMRGMNQFSTALKTSAQDLGSVDRVYLASIKKIELGADVYFGNYAFAYMVGLTSVTIPSYLTLSGTGVFSYCYSLKAMVVNGVSSNLNDSLFGGCTSLIRVALPRFTGGTGSGSFSGNNAMQKIIIPSTATYIAQKSFYACNGMPYAVVPESVTRVLSQAFAYCFGMAELHFKATTPPTITSDTFASLPTDCKIYVPSASVEAYKTATNWSSYASYIVGE